MKQVIVFLLLVCTLFCGCGKETNEPAKQETNKPTEPENESSQIPEEPVVPEKVVVYLLDKSVICDSGYTQYYYDENHNIDKYEVFTIENELMYTSYFEDKNANGMASMYREEWSSAHGNHENLTWFEDGKLKEKKSGDESARSQFEYDQAGKLVEKREYYGDELYCTVHYEYEADVLQRVYCMNAEDRLYYECRVEDGRIVDKVFYEVYSESYVYEYDTSGNLEQRNIYYEGDTSPSESFTYKAVEVDVDRAVYLLEQQKYLLSSVLEYTWPMKAVSTEDVIANQSETEDVVTVEGLRRQMEAEGKLFAVADLGLSKLSDESEITDYLMGKYPHWIEKNNFICQIPEERIIFTCDYNTVARLVCIVPRDQKTAVRVNVTRYMDETPYERVDVVYYGDMGEPVLLLVNASDDVTVSIDMAVSEEQEMTWYPYFGSAEPVQEDAYVESLLLNVSPFTDKNAYQNALEQGWRIPDESFKDYHYWESTYGYQLELYYSPDEFYDGDAYLYSYSGTDDVGDKCYIVKHCGYWSYTNGNLYLEVNDQEGNIFEGEFPILTDPDRAGALRIFRTEEGIGLPHFDESMQCDELYTSATDTISPYDYALSMGGCIPELEELMNTGWQSWAGYAFDLIEDGVRGDNAGKVIFYDVSETGVYTQSYTGTWRFEDGMLHLMLIPKSEEGQFIDDSFPVLILDGELWIGRNEYGNGLPYFYSDMLCDTLVQPMG